MGSSGTGRFSDYSNNGKGGKKSSDGSNGSGEPIEGGGGASGKDPCDRAISTELEEVDICQYYKKHSSVPPKGTQIIVQLQGRVGVETLNGDLIGYLPTRYNYLVSCIQNGRLYDGRVSASSAAPIALVQVDIAPV